MIDDGTGLRELRAWMIDRDATLRAHAFPRKERIGKLFDELLPKLTALSAVAPPPVLPPEATPIAADGLKFGVLKDGDWAIPTACGARIVDARMAYGWNECRKEMLAASPAAPAQPEGGEVDHEGDGDALMRVYDGLMAAWEGLGCSRAEGSHAADVYDWAQTVYYAARRRQRDTRPAPAQQAVTDEIRYAVEQFRAEFAYLADRRDFPTEDRARWAALASTAAKAAGGAK